MPLKKKPTKKKSKAQTPIHPGKMLEKFIKIWELNQNFILTITTKALSRKYIILWQAESFRDNFYPL